MLYARPFKLPEQEGEIIACESIAGILTCLRQTVPRNLGPTMVHAVKILVQDEKAEIARGIRIGLRRANFSGSSVMGDVVLEGNDQCARCNAHSQNWPPETIKVKRTSIDHADEDQISLASAQAPIEASPSF